MSYLTLTQAARILGQSRQNLWLLAKSGKLKTIKAGKYFIVRKAIIDKVAIKITSKEFTINGKS